MPLLLIQASTYHPVDLTNDSEESGLVTSTLVRLPFRRILTIEKDWNPITWEEAQTTDQHITGYRASKTFAEKAAWQFIEENKPHFDIITIQPPMVFGPCEHDVTLDSLNESNAQIWRIISSGKDGTVPPTGVFRWVDVRDVAAAHVNALNEDVKGNQRFLISGGEFSWQRV